MVMGGEQELHSTWCDDLVPCHGKKQESSGPVTWSVHHGVSRVKGQESRVRNTTQTINPLVTHEKTSTPTSSTVSSSPLRRPVADATNPAPSRLLRLPCAALVAVARSHNLAVPVRCANTNNKAVVLPLHDLSLSVEAFREQGMARVLESTKLTDLLEFVREAVETGGQADSPRGAPPPTLRMRRSLQNSSASSPRFLRFSMEDPRLEEAVTVKSLRWAHSCKEDVVV